jgi:bifunctional DNase/RNase
MLIEMSIRGLMVDPITNMPIVILRDADNQRVLPIWVGPVEANAIALQIENVAPPRPMTHDLLMRVLAELGATLVRVIIEDLKDNTFYAYLELDREGEPLLIDARPSDALALALRTKARVFVHPQVLDQAKSIDVSPDKADQERLQRWLESLDPDDLGYKM